MLDFVVQGEGTKFVMAVFPQLPKYDTGLFTRPFRNNVWGVIGVISFTILASVIVISRASTKKGATSISIRIVVSVAWLTFFLVSVHYDGALTMFFTTEITVPFETRRDGMDAYPEWKTMIRKGNQRLFRELSEQGDPVYVEYYDRLENEPDEVYYNSIQQGIDLMTNDQVIIHIGSKALRQYYKKNPAGERPKTFQSEGENFKTENMLVTNNSPLGPILSYGCQLLRESGIMGTLDRKWMGQEISEGGGGGAVAFTLEPGQVMMIFAILCAAIGLALIILGVEHLILTFKDSKLMRMF
jgi:hypothetical protein